MARKTFLAVILAAVCWVATTAESCSQTSGSAGGGADGGTPCIILANGGRKLCGGDAAAWCRATDSIRQGSSDPGLQKAQQDCDQLESQYPQ